MLLPGATTNDPTQKVSTSSSAKRSMGSAAGGDFSQALSNLDGGERPRKDAGSPAGTMGEHTMPDGDDESAPAKSPRILLSSLPSMRDVRLSDKAASATTGEKQIADGASEARLTIGGLPQAKSPMQGNAGATKSVQGIPGAEGARTTLLSQNLGETSIASLLAGEGAQAETDLEQPLTGEALPSAAKQVRTERVHAASDKSVRMPALEMRGLSAELLKEGVAHTDTRPTTAKPSVLSQLTLRTSSTKDQATPAEKAEGVKAKAAVPESAGHDAQAMLSLLSGAAAAEAVPAQPVKAAAPAGGRATAEGGKLTSEKTVSGPSTATDKNDLLDMAVAKDVLDKDILQRKVADRTGEERTFRLSSGNGSRASVDMTIGTDQDGKATVDTSKKSTAGVETVTVLDSRRYLGFVQSTNAAALTSVLSSDPEWQSAMHPSAALSNAATQSSTGNVVNTLKLQLTPIDLGTVTATLRLVGEELSVHLSVETRAAHQQLSDDSSGIMDALRAQGFSVDQVTVSMSPPAQTDTLQQQGDGQQRFTDAQQQQSEMQGQGRQSGQSSSDNRYGSTANDTAADPRNDTADPGTRADHLYL